MKRWLACLLAALPMADLAADYQSTTLVQTGQLRESDLIVRTVTDLENNSVCLAFYIRTVGTSPAMTCYDAVPGFRSELHQVGHFTDGKLVVRKLHDSVNHVSCLVAYASTEGTSPVIECYKSREPAKRAIVRKGHLQQGDLHVHRIVDPETTKTCLVAYVAVGGTSPALTCYDSVGNGQGGLEQTGELREGDLLVRKIRDNDNRKECMITYVSTEGTSPFVYCLDKVAGLPAGQAAAAPAPAPAPAVRFMPAPTR